MTPTVKRRPTEYAREQKAIKANYERLKAERLAREQDNAKLAAKIVDAMKEYDVADATRKEKAIAAGRLLVEARNRHPSKEAFKKFLELTGGIRISRAETLIAFALGRKDFEQHQLENTAAQRRHQDKLKAEKIEREKAKAPLPKPNPKPSRPLHNGSGKGTSVASLREFEFACETYLPKLDISDLEKADTIFAACRKVCKAQFKKAA